jgi:hypothetical protein
MGTIIEWLTKCMSNHPLCFLSNRELPILPTRVLDLGPPGALSSISLLVTNGQRARYTALSHCWGAKPPLQTTKATIEALREAIEFTALPKTFQDAIYVTRSLTIRYLWIDSLCIIQDDGFDWERECAKMASVYEGSYLTIAATAAAGGHVGCIHALKPANQFEYKEEVYFLRQVCNEIPDQSVQPCLSTPLEQRGWAFQESLLSRRVLNFGKNQLFWKCASRHTSEDGTVDLFEPEYKVPVRFVNTATPVSLRIFLQELEEAKRHSTWLR